jgi:hypothetical protein
LLNLNILDSPLCNVEAQDELETRVSTIYLLTCLIVHFDWWIVSLAQ